MTKVFKSHPPVLRYDVEERLEPHALWLEEEGLAKDGINKVVLKIPQVKNDNECYKLPLGKSHGRRLPAAIGARRSTFWPTRFTVRLAFFGQNFFL